MPTRRGLTVLLAVVRTTASLISRRDQIEKDARELSLKIKDHQPGTTVSPHAYVRTLHIGPSLPHTHVHASTSMIPTTGTDTMRRGFIMCLCVCFYIHTCKCDHHWGCTYVQYTSLHMNMRTYVCICYTYVRKSVLICLHMYIYGVVYFEIYTLTLPCICAQCTYIKIACVLMYPVYFARYSPWYSFPCENIYPRPPFKISHPALEKVCYNINSYVCSHIHTYTPFLCTVPRNLVFIRT